MNNEPQIILRRGKEESLLRYHPWIFSGAIYGVIGDDPKEGQLVTVLDSERNFAARGHFQHGSIAVRILTFENEAIDVAWWEGRIASACRLRRALGLVDNPSTTCYRLIHGEGDSLPGLVIDIYGRIAVMQAHSMGMYLAREEIARAIRAVCGDAIEAVYDKSSGTLPGQVRTAAIDQYLFGAAVPEPVLENGKKFLVNWERGQKTGFFLDQRDNRALVEHYARGRKVLNTFCYTGGFSVYALQGGATQVDSVDSSQRAVETARENVDLNFGTGALHRAITADAFEYLKTIDDGYGMIILDPPAFAKHHKVLGNALQGYKRLNARAFSQIRPGGILFTFSCSQAVGREQFRQTIFSAAAIAGRQVRILHQLTQPADHPVSIYHPEGEYLKGLVLYVE
ncbi:MAG: class I SAM-dependent rRNA methyltransferase [Rikenellaceae bacterium]|jgi:23S rRNA (cytosine1962-C5)-methyltransferase|nr:class I SAM-dependent rRNA methyltransferase [Rikenellaceae bacterium]